jgi:hypothetical protein
MADEDRREREAQVGEEDIRPQYSLPRGPATAFPRPVLTGWTAPAFVGASGNPGEQIVGLQLLLDFQRGKLILGDDQEVITGNPTTV